MPTPGGKPRVGERIRLYHLDLTLPGGFNTEEFDEGVVVHRSQGGDWSLKVRWDHGPTNWIVSASWFMQQGRLAVL